jgi:hypothetical protein
MKALHIGSKYCDEFRWLWLCRRHIRKQNDILVCGYSLGGSDSGGNRQCVFGKCKL